MPIIYIIIWFYNIGKKQKMEMDGWMVDGWLDGWVDGWMV